MDILGIAPYNMKQKQQKGAINGRIIRPRTQKVNKVEIDNELDKFVKAHLG